MLDNWMWWGPSGEILPPGPQLLLDERQIHCFVGPHNPHLSHYLLSASRHPQVVTTELEKEVAAGRVLGPFVKIPIASFRSSGLGAIPKKNGKWRMILHLSAPYGGSVNDGIHEEQFPVHYATVDDAVDLISRFGTGAILAKIDLKAAFRMVSIHPDDWDLLGMQWQGSFYMYLDTCLPFGLRSAPFLFNQFAEVLHWILHNNYQVDAVHFLIVGAPGADQCAIISPIDPEATRISFLGIMLDSEAQILSLPQDKLEYILHRVHSWLGRRSATKRELLSLISRLSFASKVVTAGRLLFLRRLIDLSNGQQVAPSRPTLLGSQGRSCLQELFAILAAAGTWHHKLTGRRVIFHCDNLAVVHAWPILSPRWCLHTWPDYRGKAGSPCEQVPGTRYCRCISGGDPTLPVLLSHSHGQQAKAKRKKNSAGSPVEEQRNEFLKGTRKGRRVLDVQKKLDVIEMLDKGKTQREVAAQLGVSKTQVLNISRCRAALYKRQLTSKVAKFGKFADIDKAVFDWFCRVRTPVGLRKPLPVSLAALQACARHEARLRNVHNFKASDGWVRRWRKRFNVPPSVHLHGEAGDICLIDAEKKMDVLRSQLSEGGYALQNIFNMDETGLFYRALPKRSYVLPDVDVRQKGRGTKALTAKDRVTLVLCCNATGTCKVAPLMIGTSKNPRCFKKQRPPFPYTSQPNAWSDGERFKFWFNDVFLPCIRKSKVALLLDGFSGHCKDIGDPKGQVSVLFFPPNLTSMYQPLDQGIISAVKCTYKYCVLDRLLTGIDKYDELHLMASHIVAGCRGLEYCLPPNLLDTAIIWKKAWDELDQSVIVSCWVHSHCLPVTDEAIVASEHRDYRKATTDSIVTKMCDQLKSLDLQSDSTVGTLQSIGILDAVSAVGKGDTSLMEKWIDVEDDQEVAASIELQVLDKIWMKLQLNSLMMVVVVVMMMMMKVTMAWRSLLSQKNSVKKC
eukprot:Em0001g2108a